MQAHYERTGIPARVENTDLLGRYRTYYEISGNPKVTILIPNRDHGEDLARCIRSVQGKTAYENYEILVIENNSREKETFELYRELQENGEARVITWEHPFQYAAIHNFAVKEARGDYLVFLNNDTEVISESWLEEMLGICQKPQVGAVGAKLFYPDGTIQHAGVILGLGGVAGHIYAGFPGDKDGVRREACIRAGSIGGDRSLHDDEKKSSIRSWEAWTSVLPWPIMMWITACGFGKPDTA